MLIDHKWCWVMGLNNPQNRDIGSHTEARDEMGVRRPCFPPCSDQRNKVSVTTSVFPNRNTFLAGPEFCLLFQARRQFNKILIWSIIKNFFRSSTPRVQLTRG